MPIGTFAEFQEKLKNAELIPFIKGVSNAVFPASSYTTAPNGGSAPAAAATCSSADSFAIAGDYMSGYTADRYLAEISTEIASATGAGYLLCDRLVHTAGLSGADAAVQTVQLPTPALPRFTTGFGVMIGIEFYTSVGTGAQTATVKYTNQSGVSNRTTKPIVFGGTNNNSVQQLRICPLQDGDTGVQSVESVTISSSTGAAGNFGITLFKPLTIVSNTGFAVTQVMTHKRNGVIGGGGQLPRIPDGACLFLLSQAGSSTPACHSMKIIEG